MAARKNTSLGKSTPAKRCGLCGKTRKLVKTECCDNWICDDEENYAMFSYARNSCHRNHRMRSLCAHHFNEEHEGDWWECKKCREDFPTPEYVWLGTSEANFRKLENPPAFEPIRCATCSTVIDIGNDGYSMRGDDYFCQACGLRSILARTPTKLK